MSKGKNKSAKSTRKRKQNRMLLSFCGAAVVLIVVVCLLFRFGIKTAPNVADYQKKMALLKATALTKETQETVGKSPAGGRANQVVFISLCNTMERASVFCGTGSDLNSAWEAANDKAIKFLKDGNYDPVWVKVDVVYTSRVLVEEELSKEVLRARSEFYRYGIAFDDRYETALLEAELNGAKIYDYENGGLDLAYLNTYLKKAGRAPLDRLPDAYTMFQCAGWLCDENNDVWALNTDGLDYGRRSVTVDADYARELIMNASAFLTDQVQEDGSFIYGLYPRFDNEIDNYNIVRHASTLWSLICRYRLAPDEKLAEQIEQTINFMLGQVIYDSQGRAYLYEKKGDEIKLGGCSMAVVALTEYMDIFQNEKYKDVCCALGNGILSMMDPDSGEYYHVLNGDFTRKEEYRTVYYDGEATFALCRLYGLTGEPIWLDAAKSAVNHFIEADYTQYKDHWVAYSMNEITKHIPDNKEYYEFALANAQKNLQVIKDRDTTYHTYLELLMATFEVYDRATEHGITVKDFDLRMFMDTISTRADRQLNGYFYPEYAMYMRNPKRILNTFMVRHDGYRVRIDDVQHNIGGYYLFFKNYDKLVSYGLLDSEAQGNAAPLLMEDTGGLEKVKGVTVQARDGGVKISWNSVKGADGYCIFRYKDGAYTPYKFSESAGKSFLGLENGKEYIFAVAAYVIEDNAEQYGELSEPVSVVPINDTLSISESALVLKAGDTHELYCRLSDEPQRMDWSSSDPSVVAVDKDGVITALAQGTAKITAEKDGTSCSCTVHVDRQAPNIRISTASRYTKNSDGIYTNNVAGDTATLMFTGDLMALGPQMRAAQQEDGWHDFSPSFSQVSGIFSKADLVVGNLETTLSESFPYAADASTYMGICNCNAPSSYLDALKAAGYDLLLTANNHYCDAGPAGLLETLEHLDEYNFMHIGTYRNSSESRVIIVEVNGIKVGFLNYNQKSTNKDTMFTESQQEEMLGEFSRSRVPDQIDAARKLGAEYIIVYIHYGKQNSVTLSEVQKSTTQYLADCGADLIVGSHPHLLQQFGTVTAEDGRTVPVVYSMGNFCSSMAELSLNKYNIILNVKLERQSAGTIASEITYIPCCILSETSEGSYIITPTWKTEGLTQEQVKELAKAQENIIAIIGNDISPVLSD